VKLSESCSTAFCRDLGTSFPCPYLTQNFYLFVRLCGGCDKRSGLEIGAIAVTFVWELVNVSGPVCPAQNILVRADSFTEQLVIGR
jgi:hypothetical protein